MLKTELGYKLKHGHVLLCNGKIICCLLNRAFDIATLERKCGVFASRCFVIVDAMINLIIISIFDAALSGKGHYFD